jgi:hypothetical protein
VENGELGSKCLGHRLPVHLSDSFIRQTKISSLCNHPFSLSIIIFLSVFEGLIGSWKSAASYTDLSSLDPQTALSETPLGKDDLNNYLEQRHHDTISLAKNIISAVKSSLEKADQFRQDIDGEKGI